jgi:hypothetical protein
MTPIQALTGTEAGLVAYFQFSEGTGTTFRDKRSAITGTLTNASLWSKAIETNPSPLSDGVWFVIQNKNEVDTDFGVPARRMALKPNGLTVSMAAIPLTGNYDEFLWRTVRISKGLYKLVNKKLGMGSALDCSLTIPTIGVYGNYSAQGWVLSQSNITTMGTNVYTMSNQFITDAKALSFIGGTVVVAPKVITDTKQAWVFQPMEVALGYQIPAGDAADYPFTRKLTLEHGYYIRGSNSTSDWAMLNAHLVYKNMFNAILNRSLAPQSTSRRDISIVSGC